MATGFKVQGIYYESKTRLLDAYGVSAYHLNRLLKTGMNAEDAILELDRSGLTKKSAWLRMELMKRGDLGIDEMRAVIAMDVANDSRVYSNDSKTVDDRVMMSRSVVSDGRVFEIDDRTFHGLDAVGAFYGIPVPTLRNRLAVGMNIGQAVSRRYLMRNKASEMWYGYENGLYKSLRDLSVRFNEKPDTFRKQYMRGKYDGVVTEFEISDPMESREVIEESELYVEYEGYRYVSIDSFLGYYGVRIGEYVDKLDKGYSRVSAMDWLRENGRSKI